jgi:hypothetical protein
MESNQNRTRSFRRRADPPKRESGRIGTPFRPSIHNGTVLTDRTFFSAHWQQGLLDNN